MDIHQDNEMERGSILTPQIIILILFVIGVPVVSLLFSRNVTPEKPSLYGVYQGNKSSQEGPEELPNRKAEVDAALKDVDFEKFDYQVQLETTLGTILLDLRPDLAPGHCKNMIGLCRIGFYDGIVFHRVIPRFMVQAGDPRGDGSGGPGYTIPPEFSNKKHLPGVLSMARGDDPGSAGSQFFICVEASPDLDGSYTVFGQTADEASLEVARKISQMPTIAERPTKDIVISSARVIEKPK